MRWLVDARSMVDPSGGGVSRVGRGLIEAFIAVAANDAIVLATTGWAASSPATALNTIGKRDPASCGDKQQAARDARVHIYIPNKLWSAACLSGLTSLDRVVEKRAGKIGSVFLPNIGFVGPMKRPYVLLLHDLSFLIEPEWFPRKMRWWHRAVGAAKLIRGAAHLLAVSETTKRDAVRLLGIPPERITVLPIGPTLIPLPTGLPAYRPTASPYILALGWGDPRKNTATAIAAVDGLRRDPAFSDLQLIIVGRDVVRPSDTELASLYANAAAFLYPSWYEGYGLPLHEAASFGTPCVASTAGALTETAPPGTFFADPAKPHHWVEALRIALTFPRPVPIDPNPDAWLHAAKILHTTLDSVAKH
ncbi:glycosyltransferase family 4 protein [Candidatus Uhrbacteria bacterium]|nr:glycosyltransferase family 4 protein [Candidatus Uhrbacteria bacterium]